MQNIFLFLYRMSSQQFSALLHIYISFQYWHSGINRYNLIILLQNRVQTKKQRAAVYWRTGQQTHLSTGPMAPNKHRFVISPHGAATALCNQKPSTTNKTQCSGLSPWLLAQYTVTLIVSLAWSGYAVSTLHQPIQSSLDSQLSQGVL